ncbi:MAG: response regulator [Eubacterium sp.]|nr:response regulator [Eubacterium sp.]
MVLDYAESIVQLLSILIALLISLFKYISSNRRGWLYAVVFFIGNLLSSYFWTANLILMGDSPNTSAFITYFGWNIGFFVILLMLIHMKSKSERRYFNPLMLLPIPLNAWQFTLYIEYGNMPITIYQVVVTTAISCFALQGILWYLKNRKKGANPPYIAIAVLIYITAEYGMWTTTCFEGWISDLYYPCSFLSSLNNLFLLFTIERYYVKIGDKSKILIDKKIQNILKSTYVGILLVGSIGGVLLGRWIKRILSAEVADFEETDVFEIIPIILFLVSIILAVFAIAIIFIVYFEQKVAENNKLREARSVAEKSNAAKSDFLANMSHEIRTPINAVLGMNEMILNDSLRARDNTPEDKEKVKKIFSNITAYSGNIDSAGKNLLFLINDILDFSKIEAGKMEINEDNYKFSSVLNDVSNMIVFKAKDKELSYYVDVDENLPDGLFGDELRVRQIMTNILNNAVKYTEKGSVTLSVKRDKKQSYSVGEKSDLIISVKDTGIGIKEEDTGKLFGKFERVDLKKNSTVEGTGLGLAITQKLIEMMGGSIEVQSVYGEGSEFKMRLPQKISSTEPVGNFREKFRKNMEKATAEVTTYTAPDAKILVVDDTSVNLVVAKGLLRDTEIQIDTADSGKKALIFTQDIHYDIIFMDQRMPEMDGTETLQYIVNQENGANVETPVICLTADALSGAKERYTDEGFTDYLSKPIDSSALKDMVKKYLPKEKVIEA